MSGRVSGSGELVAVQTGSIQLRVAPGTIWTLDETSQILAETEAMGVARQRGAAIDGASVITYRAVGPEVLDAWVVDISPGS